MSAPTNPSPASSLNHLLATLPPEEMEVLRPDLEEVSLAFKQTLFEANKPVEQVHFLHRGVASVIQEMEDGTVIEVATVGPEGMVGLSVFLHGSEVASTAFAQVPG